MWRADHGVELPAEVMEIRNRTLKEEEVTRLEAEIEEGKKKRSGQALSFKKPLPPVVPNEAALRQVFSMCQESYDNEEWEVTSPAYGQLLETGVDYVPLVRARLAYSLAQIGEDLTSSFSHAKKSIEEYPEQPDAYAAMALLKLSMSQPAQADLWLQLAFKASSSVPRSYVLLRGEIDWLNKQGTHPHSTQKCCVFAVQTVSSTLAPPCLLTLR